MLKERAVVFFEGKKEVSAKFGSGFKVDDAMTIEQLVAMRREQSVAPTAA